MAPQANFYSLGKICCGHFKVVAGTILRNKNLNFRAQKYRVSKQVPNERKSKARRTLLELEF